MILRLLVFSFLCASGLLHGTEMSHDERAQHGKSGFSKVAFSALGVAALHHMGHELWTMSEPLRKESADEVIKGFALKRTFLSSIAFGALAYLTFQASHEGIASLVKFFDDEEDASTDMRASSGD